MDYVFELVGDSTYGYRHDIYRREDNQLIGRSGWRFTPQRARSDAEGWLAIADRQAAAWVMENAA